MKGGVFGQKKQKKSNFNTKETRRCDATTFCRDHHHPCRDFARSQYYPLPSTDVVVEAALEMCVRVLLAVVVAWGTR